MADFSRMRMFERLAAGQVGPGDTGRDQPLSAVFPGTIHNDNIDGTEGDDTMRGQSGNDKLRGLGGADDMDGGSGNDSLYGGNDNDLITDGESGGLDKIDGGDGADTITSLGGNDNVHGGFGHDVITVTDQSLAIVNGDEGNDRITLVDMLATNLIKGGDTDPGGVDTLELGAGVVFGPVFEAKKQGFDALDAGTVQGDGGDNRMDFSGLVGLQADIHFVGGFGNDTIRGLGQGDVIDGGGDRDALSGLGGADRIQGGTGRDTLLGGEGDDTLEGGGQDDSLDGGAGNDDLRITGAVRMADGGIGDDLFRIGNASVLSDAVLGGAGADTIELGNFTTFGGDFFGRDQGFEMIDPDFALNTFGGVAHKIDLSGMGVLAPHTGVVIVGDSQADKLTATAVNDSVVGHGGGDTIKGGAGNDTAFGGDGADWLVDGIGDNDLRGEAGIDWLSLQPAMGGATVDLSISGFQDTGVGMSSFSGVENVLGGRFGDTISGNDLANVFEGAAGGDTMTAGLGGDSFIWRLISHTSKANPDFLFGVGAGTTLNFQLVDADVTKAGNQAFKPESAFHNKAGEATIVFDAVNNRTVISLDDDGDGVADGRVIMSGAPIDYEIIW